MMSKLKEIIKDKNIDSYRLTKNTGNPQRNVTLTEILNGKRDITTTNINILSSFARGLGVKLTDILNDFDLDGTSSQVINAINHCNKIRNLKKLRNGIHKIVDDENLVLVSNPTENDFKYNKFKTSFDFIKPDRPHNDQIITETYILNRKYLEYPHDSLIKNSTLSDTTQKLNSHATSYIVYTPIKNEDEIIGGDLKLGITINDVKGNFLFTEIYGCEFMDTEDNRNIAYYKGRDDFNSISDEIMESTPKMEISELEFYNNLFSQYWKYGIAK